MSPIDASSPPVRTARAADAEGMAQLLWDGLGAKFRPALGRSGRGRLASLIRHEIDRGEAYFVSADELGVTGVAHLDLGRESPAGSVRDLAAALGWPRTAWALAAWSLIDAGSRRPDDAYVEEVVVAGRARRRGLGGALLDACERRARDAGRTSVRLVVVWENQGAIALYRSRGYAIVARRRWLLGRLLYRSPGAFLMEKRLTP